MFREIIMNSLSVSRIHYKSVIFSRIYYDFTIFFANLLSINNQFRKQTIISQSVSRIHHE